ncbi:MAG TPA: hypothetical protein VKQ29_02890 [Aliidongia sp.]|nr:hypothetical protein [Aliidongia sp.]
MRRVGLAVSAVLVAAGIGYWGLGAYFDARFREALDQFLHTLPPGYAVTYASASYSPLGTAEVHGIAVHAALASGLFDGSIDRLDLVHPNLALADGWNDAARHPAAWRLDQALPLADEIRLEGVHVQSAVQTADLESERLVGARVYPAALLHPGLPTLKDISGAREADQPLSPEAMLDLARFEAAIVLGFGWDRQETVGLKAAGRTLPNAAIPDQPFSYEIARVTTNTLDRGVWQDMAGEGLSFSALSGGTAKIGRLGFSGIDVRQVATRLLDAASLAPALFDGLALKRIEYADFTLEQSGEAPVSLDDFALSDVAVVQGEPVSAALSVKGLRFDPNEITQPFMAALAGQLALDRLTLGIGFAFDRDVGSGRATIHDSFLKIDELGSVELTASLVDDPLGADPATVKLARAAVHYRDASLADRVLRLMARGGDPEQARRELILIARQQGEALGPDLAPATAALVAFLQRPISLTAELAPPQPLPLATLAAARSLPPAQVAALVGLSLKSGQ